MYDYNNSPIGYIYYDVDSNNNIGSQTIYYEKNGQGDIIGLLGCTGVEIATYAYDAWGNITSTTHNSGYNEAYNLNHLTYRGYYRDSETGFYYLQSRYYDSITMRFLNVDKAFDVSAVSDYIYKDNMFIYCNANPMNCFDPQGTITFRIDVKNLKGNIKKHGKNYIRLIIASMAYAYLIPKGYKLAYEMFEHALFAEGKKIPRVIQKKLNKTIKKNQQLKRSINHILKECKKRNVNNTQNLFSSFEFTKDKDLFYSVQHATIMMTGNKTSTNNWNVYIYAYDIYDFDDIRKWSSFANISNNLGVMLESTKVLKKYKWSIVANDNYSTS